jgi:hypothetical protein
MLTKDSFFNQDSFKDEIGRYSYPIDIHPMGADKKSMDGFNRSVSIKHKDGETYSIPYRCLVPKGVDNLLVAGRSISATRIASGAIRPTAQCMAMGEAAGTAASILIKNNIAARDIDISYLRECLKANGAII